MAADALLHFIMVATNGTKLHPRRDFSLALPTAAVQNGFNIAQYSFFRTFVRLDTGAGASAEPSGGRGFRPEGGGAGTTAALRSRGGAPLSAKKENRKFK